MASTSNAGFAFVVNNILSTNKNAKLLSKAKKGEKIEKDVPNPDGGFEVVDESGNITKAQIAVTKIAKTNVLKRKKANSNRYELDMVGRVKPKLEERARERKLTTVATKGVVQLFNIVRDQKKKIKTDIRQNKLPKNKRASSLNVEKDLNTAKDLNNKKWKVLKDDFNAGGKLKDWDKESDSDSN